MSIPNQHVVSPNTFLPNAREVFVVRLRTMRAFPALFFGYKATTGGARWASLLQLFLRLHFRAPTFPGEGLLPPEFMCACVTVCSLCVRPD